MNKMSNLKPYYETKLGKLYCGDCLEIMKELPEKSIDLTITSPPYDNLRKYNKYSFDFENVAKSLLRIHRDGGVIVWIIGDATINGSETGTSFKHALYFKEIGFNLHDTMIYQKDVMPFPEHNRYNQCFEYMFVLSRGKPKTFNPIKESTRGYLPSRSSTTRNRDGTTSKLKYEQGKSERNLFNIWKFNVGFMKSTKDRIAYQHPAIFPDKLAEHHIISWSNKNDLILDPFLGSGTTAVACEKLGRRWIGIEISEKYCEIAATRIAHNVQLFT